ncbi:MAG: hypothetical protein ACPGJV_11855 [Bacteriovoracaceae bacterium]
MLEKENIKYLFRELNQRFDKSELSDLLEVSRKTLSSATERGDIVLYDLVHISEKLNIAVENILSQNYDLPVACNYIEGEKQTLPNRYNRCFSSRIRTIKSALSLLGKMSKQNQDFLLRKFQLTPEILENEDELIGGQLLLDIYSYVDSQPIFSGKKVFEILGHSASDAFKGSELAGHLKNYSGAKEALEYFIEELTPIVETNQDYKIHKSDSNSIIFSHNVKDSISESLQTEHYGGPNMDLHIKSWFSNFTTFIGLQPVEVKKRSCVQDGDSTCKYELYFPQTFWKQRFFGPKHSDTPQWHQGSLG